MTGEILLPWPPREAGNKWSDVEEAALSCWLEAGKNYSEIATASGRSVPALRNKAWRLGITTDTSWSDEDVARLRELYRHAPVIVAEVAASLNRTPEAIYCKADELKITDPNRIKKRPEDRTTPRRRMYDTDEELSAARSAWIKAALAKNGHPRGMAGKHHSKKTRLTFVRLRESGGMD